MFQKTTSPLFFNNNTGWWEVFYVSKTAREENKAQAVTRETIYVPFCSYIMTGFCTRELLCEHIPSVASLFTINVNHISLRALLWLSLCLWVLSSFLVCSFPLLVSQTLCFCFVCLLAFLCDSVWLFGLKLIPSVPAGLGRTTQITITNQTPTPTVVFSTPLSLSPLFKFCSKSVWLCLCPVHSPISVCPCSF